MTSNMSLTHPLNLNYPDQVNNNTSFENFYPIDGNEDPFLFSGVFNESTFSTNDSNDTFYDDDFVPFRYPSSFRMLCYVLYNLVFIVGLLGNLLVFYTIHYTHPSLKTVQNYFLGNLALGDLLIVIVCVPTGYVDILWQYWPFGSALCHLLTPVKAVTVFVSSYTLVALAIDRYVAILYPLQPGIGRRECRFVLVGIWVAAVITAIPVGVNVRVEEFDGLTRCGEYGWNSHVQELLYSLALLFLQYLFPVIVLAFTYSKICCVVWGKSNYPGVVPAAEGNSMTRGSLRQGQGLGSQIQTHNGGGQSGGNMKGKRKTIILSLSVVLGYTLAWLPWLTIYMVYKHGPEWILDGDWFPYLFLICHWLSMGHACFNFMIYFWINSRFRRAFIQVLYVKCPFVGLGPGDLDGRNGSTATTTTRFGYGRRFRGFPGTVSWRTTGTGNSFRSENGEGSERHRRIAEEETFITIPKQGKDTNDKVSGK